MTLNTHGATTVATAPPPAEPASPTVRVKTCCGVLVGEQCDCRLFAAEARGVFARPIMCRPATEWGTA